MKYGWLLIVIGAAIWGLDGVLLTPRYFTYGLFNVTLIVFIAHLLPLVYMSIQNPKNYLEIRKFSKSNILYLLLIAILGGTVGTLSIVKALQLSEFNPFSIVVLIQKSQPIFAVISAYFLLHERPNKKFKIVFVISIVAIYILTFGLHSPANLAKSSILASAYSLLAAISFGISTTIGRKIATELKGNVVVFYRFLFTTIITLIMLLFNPIASFNDLAFAISNKQIVILAFVISIFSVLAAHLYYIGLTHTKAIYATICELAFPITSVVLDITVNGSYLEPVKLIAAAVLILAIVFLNLDKNDR